MKITTPRFVQPVSLPKIILFVMMLLILPFVLSSPKNLSTAKGVDAVGGPKIVVLNYHKIDNMNISLSVLPQDFEQQLKYLKDNGYTSITPMELYEAIEHGGPLPEKPLLITFDDGYDDNYRYAYPLLKKYGFKGTIFVITSFLDRGQQGYITWAQASEMEASGVIDIESHTVTHGSMTEMTDSDLRRELADSKKDIEQRLGKTVNFVAYPTGTYNLHIASLVKEAGYRGAFTIEYGNVDKASNIYAIERVPIFHTEDTYASFLERLQYIPIFERLGWIKS